MSDGWILIHRKIMQHGFYHEKPFTRLSAWIDLLLLANSVDNKVYFDGSLVDIKRGQHITSIRKLCVRWGWSNTKTVRFLECLKNENMLSYFSDTKKTVITIVNYSLYQDVNVTKTLQKRHRNDTETTQKHTNKEDLYIDTLNNIDQSVSQSYKETNIKTFFKTDKCQTNDGQTTDICQTNDRQMLQKIIKAAQIDNYIETTAMFIKGVIKKLIDDSAIATKWKLEMTHQEIIERLRHCRLEHLEAAMRKMENCQTNKEIYFAKCLLTAIVERGIEEIFEEDGS